MSKLLLFLAIVGGLFWLLWRKLARGGSNDSGADSFSADWSDSDSSDSSDGGGDGGGGD